MGRFWKSSKLWRFIYAQARTAEQRQSRSPAQGLAEVHTNQQADSDTVQGGQECYFFVY